MILRRQYLYLQVLLGAIALILALTNTALCQEAARPDRGTMPNRNYSVSDIENINLQNGNVSLSIPLAALPPIAGGKLSWTVNAHYNSKIWDVLRMQEEQPDLQWAPYVVDTPAASGGWSIGGQYSMYFRNANDDFSRVWYNENSGLPYWELNLLNNYQWWKVVLFMPDGSEHEFRPTDYGSYYGSQDFLRGYYNVIPSGSPIRYHSVDGTYMFARISNWSDWTVYMPDGTQIIQTPDGIQRIQDTNGNKIKIFNDGNGTHYQDEQTGREVRITYDPSANGGQGQYRVWYPTVGGSQQYIDINMGSTTVQGKVYTVNDWDYGGEMVCQRTAVLWTQLQVVREIVFPQTEPGQQRKFAFSYNSDTTETASDPVNWSCNGGYENYVRSASIGWGELSRVVSPPGTIQNSAYADYSYELDSSHSLLLSTDDLANQGIAQKKLTHDGTFDIWTYSISESGTFVTSPDGNGVSEARYCATYGVPGCSTDKAGLAYRTTRPFMMTERHWTNLAFYGADLSAPGGVISFNPVVDFEYTTLLDANNNALKMSAKAFQYDYNGNVTQTTEYDWFDPALVSRDAQGVPTGVPGSAAVLRVTNNAHYNQATGSTSANVYAKRSVSTGAPLILNAPQQSTTGPAIVQLSYDGQPYGSPPTVGNLTTKSVWFDLESRWITTSNTYGLYGNLATTTDALGKVTTFGYLNPALGLPTSVTVDPQNGTGTQTTETTYDYYTGLVTSTKDSNLNITTINYTNQLLGTIDPFGRPGVIIGPDMGGGANHLTTMTYLDNARQVIVATDLNAENDKLLKSRTTVDMLGRPVLTEQTEDGTNYTITAQRAYDLVNNVTYASNPKRSTSAATDGWTRTKTDTAGRVIEVASFTGASQPPVSGTNGNWTGSVTTSYSSNEVTVTDQAGKQRKSVSNALGQLTSVFENPAGLNYQTSYDYDVLGNLRHVYQGSQTRTFTYDSLSRLRTAVNPESGTMTYAYDDNGNLTSKVDARSITTTYAYDSLNRVTSRSYSDGTPTVTYVYDAGGVTNSKGRLTSMSSSVSATNYTAYNGRGSVTAANQVTDGQTYSMSYAYNLAGSPISMTYPSGRVITSAYDNAGRLAGVRDQSSGVYYAGAASTDATNRLQYAAHGAVSVMKLGNGLWEHTNFNARLQATEIGLGTSSTSTSVMGLTYSYGTTNNNGNVQSISYSGGGLSYTQSFGYDQLNRLTTSNENSGASWSETNGYDRYGNRWIDLGGGNQSLYFNSSNNRITNSGYVYDSAGNLTNDTLHTYGFDAENKIKTVDGVSDVYRYDGDGNRVRKNFATGEKVRMVYSGGQLIAEYALSNGSLLKEYVYGAKGLIATIEPTNGTRYATADHLGTPRVITNSSAGVISRHDYMPFGVEIGVTVGGRTAGMGYGATDNVRQKFTQKERDNETGLDFFEARYYASMQGRFTGVDSVGPDLANPQTLNKYQYCLNNPLAKVDRNGRYEEDVHRDLTRVLALAAGFNQRDAAAIAKANQWTDDNPGTSPYSSVEARKKYHFTTATRRRQLWNTFRQQGSTHHLGIYLHAVQDSFSHEGYDPETGHWTTAPDKTYNDVPKADKMALASYNALVAAAKVMYGGALTATPYEDIKPYITQFNQAKSKKDKDRILKTMTGLISGALIGTESDPNVQRIRQQYSLPGSSFMDEAMAVHEYRVQRAFAR